jgi:hypothetical protein
MNENIDKPTMSFGGNYLSSSETEASYLTIPN